jgi:hypothetical protein
VTISSFQCPYWDKLWYFGMIWESQRKSNHHLMGSFGKCVSKFYLDLLCLIGIDMSRNFTYFMMAYTVVSQFQVGT